MILQYLSEVKMEEKDRGWTETIETIRDNVTNVTEYDSKVEVTFSRPNGELDRVAFEKPHSQITCMWLLNDNFKTLKRLI